MMHFVRTLLIYACLRLIAIEEVRNYGKIVSMKNVFENGWWEDAYPSSFPPLVICCRNHQKSLVYFSHLAPLFLFFFTKKQSQKGGRGMEQCPPPKNAPAVKSKMRSICP